jgi:hypothetical protein
VRTLDIKTEEVDVGDAERLEDVAERAAGDVLARVGVEIGVVLDATVVAVLKVLPAGSAQVLTSAAVRGPSGRTPRSADCQRRMNRGKRRRTPAMPESFALPSSTKCRSVAELQTAAWTQASLGLFLTSAARVSASEMRFARQTYIGR